MVGPSVRAAVHLLTQAAALPTSRTRLPVLAVLLIIPDRRVAVAARHSIWLTTSPAVGTTTIRVRRTYGSAMPMATTALRATARGPLPGHRITRSPQRRL